MGNICSSGGVSRTYSPPTSPVYGSGVSSPSRFVGQYTLTSIHQLSSEERENFLDAHDPMRVYDLNSETSVYRTTPREYVRNGYATGNPNSGAIIALHEELQESPYAQHIGARPDQADAYRPRTANASSLNTPSLNVMAGQGALSALRGYAGSDHVTTEMRLGDFLDQGGKVYSDTSAMSAGGDSVEALIVTLPEGCKVPVNILD
ncbi:AvrPphF family type III effector [Pseudomonas savastanoi]|uniref:AvrPphF family type III effector n=1 Tax=Pseudomonas savastanoi TaxID=29438 RepID=UPI000F405455|nr:AvrPphF family type III effector [Pseudomonas savastanoi]RML89190.1 ORF2-like protein [Pseudomonas savastanoi pv. glycinea]